MDQNTIDDLIGGVPVSEQLAAVLERTSLKGHAHSNYATHDEIEDLKKKIDLLMDLVGDASVADQIATAIKNIK